MGLTPEEDRDLRRLEVMRRYGSLSSMAATRYAELRSRDRRAIVREPDDHVVTLPRQRGYGLDAEVAPGSDALTL